MFNSLIWDFDGTLFDTYPYIFECYREILRNHDADIDMDIIKLILIKESSKEAIEYIEKHSNITREEFLKEYEVVSSKEEKLRLIKPMPGIIESLELAKTSGVRNYIVTNRDDTALKILEYNDMQKYFCDLVYIGSRNEARRKPNESSFKYLISKYELRPEDTLSIGDRDLDVITSQKVSLKTCLINPIRGFKSKPDYIARDFKDFVSLVRNLIFE